MKTLHTGPDLVPGDARFPLGDPHKKEGQKADEHVGGDALVLMMVEGPELQGRLQRPEGPLHFEELLIAKGNVLGRKAVVAGGKNVLPVETFFLVDLCPVDDKGAVLLLFQVPPHGPVGKQRADALLVGLTPLVTEGFYQRFQTGDGLLPGCLILLGLFRVKDEDETAAPLSLADDHLLDLEVLPDSLVPPFPRKHLFVYLLVVPELFAKDVVAACSLQYAPVLLGVHAPVGHPDAAGELPAGKVLLDGLDGLHVLRVARKHPGADRYPLFRDGEADDDLGEIGSAILRMAVTDESFILLIPLYIRTRRIEEEEIDLKVEKVGDGEEDFLVNNAGISWVADALDFPIDKWQKVINLNLTGAFQLSQMAAKVMKEQGRGKIVNIASIGAFGGDWPEHANSIAYVSSKGAMITMTKDLAVKWARYGITVNAICPGWFPTGLNEKHLEELADRLIPGDPSWPLRGK